MAAVDPRHRGRERSGRRPGDPPGRRPGGLTLRRPARAPRREIVVDSIVTSIGIDLGTHLSSWSTRLVEALWFELNDNRDERLFLITGRAPEHGRSGGGLFLPDGELVGVCVGHAELIRGRRQGVFASRESIRRLLIENDLTPLIARSELQRSRLGQGWFRRSSANGGYSARPATTPVTPTRAVGGR